MTAQALAGYPLTDQQTRAWNHRRGLDFSTTAVMEIAGPLDEERLRKAVSLLVARHEILRTVYLTPRGMSQPVQVIQEKVDPWTPGSEASPFDLEKGPPCRCWIERMAPSKVLLYLRCSALNADRTSMINLFEQLVAAYAGRRSGDLPGAEFFQYADYGQWQMDLRKAPDAAQGRRFWESPSRQDQPEFRSPLEKSRESTGFVPRTIRFMVEGDLHEQIIHSTEQTGLSIEQLFLGAWTTLLSRVRGNAPVTVGVESAGRAFEELRGAVGLYDRFLPVEFKVEDGGTLAASAREMGRQLEAARRHGEYVHSGGMDSPGSLALLFSFQPRVEPISAEETTFHLLSVESCSEPCKLKLDVQKAAKHFELRLTYDSNRIPLTEANCMGERVLCLLSHALSAPEIPLARLPYVAAQEDRMLRQLAYSPPPRKVQPILQAFAEWVRNEPDRIGVACDGRDLTYAQLNARANQVANRLRALGLEPGKTVGLCVQRSVEMVVGILGILKAGGAYVPLDPAYPKDRLEFMVKDARVEILVVQPELRDLLPARAAEIVSLAPRNDELRTAGEEDPEVRIAPDQLAYVIYTSGSTGQPKGVMIKHCHLAISTAARLEYYHDPVVNYLLLSSFSFDSSIAGIFWTLATGGTLTLPAEGAHQDPGEIRRMIAASEVTHLLALPSFYQAILGSCAGPELQSLRTVIVAGENCPRDLLGEHYARCPRATLYNEYGPTEATVWSTVHRCTPQEQSEKVPIGRPVPGLGIYILDENGHHAGLGVLGEIHVAGPTLADGYLNRPELTEAKFIPNPFDEGLRLYKTGDLGRFLEDGQIEFHGRTDHQVKIRGYRIEIGEIEEVIRSYPGMGEVVVIAREESPGDQRLVAYFVWKQEQDPAAELREFLRTKLPPFMIPSAFVTVREMPLTPNGKIDRKALPAPERVIQPQGKEHAPASAEEELLAKIWSDLLNLENVGRTENFFDLGGHSLLALQMLARIRDAVKIELPLKAVFERPTVEGLAAALAQYRGNGRPAIRQIRRAPRQTVTREMLDELDGSGGEPSGKRFSEPVLNEEKGD